MKPTKTLVTLCYALLYIFGFHYAYVVYINPVFEYAHYTYLPFSYTALVSTYIVTLLPITAYKQSVAPAQALAALIYSLAYVPIQLSLLFTVNVEYDNIFKTQIMLAISMTMIFYFSRGNLKPTYTPNVKFKLLDRFAGITTIAALTILIATNIDHMRIVSFEDVYELRFESAAASKSAISGYLTSWLTYCFISYFYARGFIYRKWTLLILGLASSVLLYMATGAKAAILLMPITIALGYLWGSGRDFLPKLLIISTALFTILVLTFSDEGIGMWIKSITFSRILGNAGWVASKYYEHFTTEGVTYYSHIKIINTFTDNYQYGNLSLGQVIGLVYSGSSDANFNAGFWASDGFAALGSVGPLVITPFVVMVLLTINRIMGTLDSKFCVMWMTGFFIACLNVPLSTALLSGGGILILAQAWWIIKKDQSSRLSLSNKNLVNSVSNPRK